MADHPTIKSFAQADAYLGRKTNRPLHGRYLRIYRSTRGSIVIQYHDTVIITYRKNGTVKLHNGGWATRSTAWNISEYSPVSISSLRGKWYANGKPYRNGMIVRGR